MELCEGVKLPDTVSDENVISSNIYYAPDPYREARRLRIVQGLQKIYVGSTDIIDEANPENRG